jgi:hypothetical protein
MIILNCHTGRMSNHKIMQAHVMAEALSRGERWYIAPENWFWRFEAATLGRIWNKCVRMMKPVEGSRNRCFHLPGLTIVHGWTELRNFEALKKYGDEIRKSFCDLTQRHRDAELRFGEGCYVGVHVRRTDYKEWKGGRYWYSNEVYERVMDEVRKALGEVKFIVFTDEPESLSPRLRDLNDPMTTPERDQYLMSKCNYLIGPPSTFTAWASFMGKVSLLHLESNEQKVRMEDFSQKW